MRFAPIRPWCAAALRGPAYLEHKDVNTGFIRVKVYRKNRRDIWLGWLVQHKITQKLTHALLSLLSSTSFTLLTWS